MEKQISIIIPTYNMEKYLNKCLDSLLIPELNKIEVLVINDGSKDRSSEIAHEYENKFPDSFRVIDKKNGNYGSCINVGIREAKGRYIKILDADDYFDLTVFQNVVKKLDILNSDVILTDFDIIDEKGKVTTTVKHNIKSIGEPLDFLKIKEHIIKNSQMHGIMYLTDFIRKLNYVQTEGISYTDTEWNFIPLALASSYIYLNEGSLYKYLVGREGQTMDSSIFHKKLNDQFSVLLSRAKYYEHYKTKIDTNRQDFLKQSFKNQTHYIYLTIFGSNNKKSKIQLTEYEEKLEYISPELYNEIANLNYTPHTPYKMIIAFRSYKDKSNFKIPRWQILRRRFNGVIYKLFN